MYRSHAREALYSNSAVIAWWLQSTSGQIGMFMRIWLLKKGNKFLNILLLKVFFAYYEGVDRGRGYGNKGAESGVEGAEAGVGTGRG